MPLHPNTPLQVSLTVEGHSVDATLPLRIHKDEKDDYSVLPGEIELSVPDHLNYSVMKLHDEKIRKKVADAVNVALASVSPVTPSLSHKVNIEGMGRELTVRFPDMDPDWRNPENYRYNYYEVIGPSVLNGTMPNLRFADKKDAISIVSHLKDMSVIEHRAKEFDPLLQGNINTAPLTAILFEAIAEQVRQEHGINSREMDDIAPFMNEYLATKPNSKGLSTIFPALASYAHANIDDVIHVIRHNSQTADVDAMIVTPYIARNMQHNAMQRMMPDRPLKNPFSFLPPVAASDTLTLHFATAAQTGTGWVEGVSVTRKDGSLVGFSSPDETEADVIMIPDPAYRLPAENLIVNDPQSVENILAMRNDNAPEYEMPSRGR